MKDRLLKAPLARTTCGLAAFLAFALVLLAACSSVAPGPADEGELTLTVSSTAFAGGGQIPTNYTCNGGNVSPPLAWSGQPEATEAFAVVMDDPDAPDGLFTHWIVFNLPSDSRQLPEGVPTQEQLSSGAMQGTNDFGNTGYGGPCPPTGTAHQYSISVYALDQPLDLLVGVTRGWLDHAMHGHILARGQITGTFQR
jgi:Raf kinase inhibitor-like YbhB/YbcL family protein